MWNVTGASSGPARLPSNTRTATWLVVDVITRAMASARVTAVLLSCLTNYRLGSATDLVVQVGQTAVGVIGRLHGAVRRTVVPLPELLLRVMHRRIQGFVAAEGMHGLLH